MDLTTIVVVKYGQNSPLALAAQIWKLIYSRSNFKPSRKLTDDDGVAYPLPAYWQAKPKPSYAPANMATT